MKRQIEARKKAGLPAQAPQPTTNTQFGMQPDGSFVTKSGAIIRPKVQ